MIIIIMIIMISLGGIGLDPFAGEQTESGGTVGPAPPASAESPHEAGSHLPPLTRSRASLFGPAVSQAGWPAAATAAAVQPGSLGPHP